MNVLITGVSGFVGSHLAEYILENTSWEVFGTIRYGDPLDNLINVKDRITLIEADLLGKDSLDNAIRISQPDYVFHLAAEAYVQASFKYPEKYYQTNVTGTQNLMESIRQYAPDAWIHNCSSSEVYGRVPSGYGRIDEDCPLLPASPYSISKVGQDMVGRFFYEAHGLKVLTTRMFTHTGPRRGDVYFESSFAKQVAMCEAGMIDTIQVGNLESTRTIADVRDAVRAYYLLLTHNPTPGEIYNIGGEYTCKVGDVLNYLNPGFPVRADQSRMRPLDADFQIPNCGKYKLQTGWEPEIPFEQTMDDLLDYWRDRVRTSVVVQR